MPRSCRIFLSFILLALFANLYAARCGSKSGSSGEGSQPPEVTEIEGLPLATYAVVDDLNTEESDNDFSATLVKSDPLFAVDGLRVDASVSAAFEEDSSMAACEMYSAARRFFMYAARGDAYLCLLQRILENENSLGIDPYDGAQHVFQVETTGSDLCETIISCPTIYIVFSVASERHANEGGTLINGQIDSFEMSVCQDGQRLTHMTQAFDEYDFTMTMSGNYASELTSQSYEMALVSKMDADTEYLDQKTVTVDYSQTYDAESDLFGRASLNGSVFFAQKQDVLHVESQESGAYAEVGKTWSVNFSGEAEIIDDNSSRSKFALSNVLIGSGSGIGTATDDAYALIDEDLTLDESWEDDFVPIVSDVSVPEAIVAGRFAEDAEDDVADDSSGETAADPCTAPVAEEIFDLSDLSNSDVDKCTDFLLEDDFPNCWYIVDS
jgi:hypothetical protein